MLVNFYIIPHFFSDALQLLLTSDNFTIVVFLQQHIFCHFQSFLTCLNNCSFMILLRFDISFYSLLQYLHYIVIFLMFFFTLLFFSVLFWFFLCSKHDCPLFAFVTLLLHFFWTSFFLLSSFFGWFIVTSDLFVISLVCSDFFLF